jgi:hypothetical protein
VSALFIYDDGRTERIADVPEHLDVYVTLERPTWHARLSATLSDCPSVPDMGIKHYCHRKRIVYPPNWQGPLESGQWERVVGRYVDCLPGWQGPIERGWRWDAALRDEDRWRQVADVVVMSVFIERPEQGPGRAFLDRYTPPPRRWLWS